MQEAMAFQWFHSRHLQTIRYNPWSWHQAQRLCAHHFHFHVLTSEKVVSRKLSHVCGVVCCWFVWKNVERIARPRPLQFEDGHSTGLPTFPKAGTSPGPSLLVPVVLSMAPSYIPKKTCAPRFVPWTSPMAKTLVGRSFTWVTGFDCSSTSFMPAPTCQSGSWWVFLIPETWDPDWITNLASFV